MFRKIAMGLAAAAVVATAAIPSAASASDWHHGWRHHHRHHHGTAVRVSPYYAYASRPYYGYAPYCFTKNRWVHSHWGWQLQRVRVCR